MAALAREAQWGMHLNCEAAADMSQAWCFSFVRRVWRVTGRFPYGKAARKSAAELCVSRWRMPGSVWLLSRWQKLAFPLHTNCCIIPVFLTRERRKNTPATPARMYCQWWNYAKKKKKIISLLLMNKGLYARYLKTYFFFSEWGIYSVKFALVVHQK